MDLALTRKSAVKIYILYLTIVTIVVYFKIYIYFGKISFYLIYELQNFWYSMICWLFIIGMVELLRIKQLRLKELNIIKVLILGAFSNIVWIAGLEIYRYIPLVYGAPILLGLALILLNK